MERLRQIEEQTQRAQKGTAAPTAGAVQRALPFPEPQNEFWRGGFIVWPSVLQWAVPQMSGLTQSVVYLLSNNSWRVYLHKDLAQLLVFRQHGVSDKFCLKWRKKGFEFVFFGSRNWKLGIILFSTVCRNIQLFLFFVSFWCWILFCKIIQYVLWNTKKVQNLKGHNEPVTLK